MAAAKVTGNPALDSVIHKINKEYSKSLISLRPQIEMLPALPTGSLALDFAIGIGGLPRGRIIEIYGAESSGKTSWALFWAAQAQKQDPERYVMVVDAEHTMTTSFIKGFGVDENRLLFSRPESAPEALNPILDLVKTGSICYVVLDSIDALQTQAQLEKKIGENDMGGVTKPLSRFFREYSKVCSKHDCTSVFINQTRQNPGAQMHSDPTVTPGGGALKFYSSLRFRTAKAKPAANTPGAFTSKFKIVKNKMTNPVAREIEVDFLYAKGPDPIIDTLNAAKDIGILAFAGGTLKMAIDGVPETLCTGGKEGYIELCRDDPTVLTRIREACMEARTKVIIPIEPNEEETPPEDES